MKGKKLLVLVATAIAVGGLAYFSSTRSQRQTAPSQVGRKIFPDLPVNDAEKIVIDNGKNSVALTRTARGWVVADRLNYPANFEKLRTALRALVDLKVHQVVRINPAQKAELWLDPPKAGRDEFAGTQITLFGTGDKKIARFVIGKDHMKAGSESNPMFGGASFPDGRYIATEDGTAYLVTETLEAFVTTVRDWLDDQFVSAPPNDIRRITVSRPGQTGYTLTRPSDGADLQLLGMATNEIADATKMSQITSTLGFMRFDDVAATNLSSASTGLDNPSELKIELGDGSLYAIRIGKTIADRSLVYTTVSAAFKAPPEPVTTNSTIIAEAREKARKRQGELQALDTRLSTWIYLVSSSTIDSIMPARDTLLKRMGTPDAADAGAPAMPADAATSMMMPSNP